MNARLDLGTTPQRFAYRGLQAILAMVVLFATFSGALEPAVGSVSLMGISIVMLAGMKP